MKAYTITAVERVVSNFIITVMPWAFDTGHFSEDGAPLIGERFLVWIEMRSSGRRWEHQRSFQTHIEYDADTGAAYIQGFDKARDRATALAARIEAGLLEGRRLDPECWREIDPVYGSAAYEAQGTEAQRAFAEQRDADRSGFAADCMDATGTW